MIVRHLESKDIDVCIKMGEAMHQESRFSPYDFNRDKLQQLIDASFAIPESYCVLVVEDNNEIIGLLVGVCVEYWFGTDKQTADLAIYVNPEKRGTSAVGRLIRAYEKWASDLGVKEIGVSTSTGVETERTKSLFERLGYEPAAYAYSKRI